MRSKIIFLLILVAFLSSIALSQNLQRISYNNPGLLTDLGVGLWAWPLPMDFNENGLIDLVVVCTDYPYNGVYLFENSGVTDYKTGLPVYDPARRLGSAADNPGISYIDGKPVITTPGRIYPDFRNSTFENPVRIPAPDAGEIYPEVGRIRANQWKFIDFNGNGVNDLVVGIGFWGERDYRGIKYYGWDNAYNERGQWINGPLRGYVFVLENMGNNDDPEYSKPKMILNTDGLPVDVFGRPSPNFADFTGDGKLDLICGEFRDGFTFFKNAGTTEGPLFAPGRPLTNGDKRIRMDLCMITPVAYDFTGNGWPDLIVGDEDGRVALVEHTGEVVDGMPVFLPPRYFRQKADEIKFGALSTPVGYDWNGNGREDIITGNTAGQIAFIKNLGGYPVRWAAPELLEAGGEVIRIMAGPNGSIQGPAEAKWGYTTLSIADWNHNGLPDIIVNSIWGKVVWYENTGTRSEPVLSAARPIEVEWGGVVPKPEWNWWDPEGNSLVTQWRTTPFAVDWTGNGLTDLIMLDHQGYLALFRREIRNGNAVLLPGERVFRLEGEVGPLRLNDRRAGGSGRRKIAIDDIDGDGRPDILVNSQNATFYKNIAEEKGYTLLRDAGVLDNRRLAGHTSSPSVIDLNGDGIKGILVGAEDGFMYYMDNPFIKLPGSSNIPGSVGNEPLFTTDMIFTLQDEHVHGSTIVELPNGDLLAGWFQGSGERWADDVRIMGSRKKEGQKDWSEPFLLADIKEFPDCNPVLFMDGKGRLWLMWMTIIANQWETALLVYRISDDYMNMTDAPNWNWQDILLLKPGGETERGVQPGDPFVASVKQQLDEYMEYIKSDPEKTHYADAWDQRAERILSHARGENMIRAGRIYQQDGQFDEEQLGYPYFRRMGWQTGNKPFITEAGRMIVPLYSDGFSISIMAYTDDWGENWKTSTPLVGSGNIQPAIAKAPDGDLVAYMRDNGPPPKRLHISRSGDSGETWSNVRDSEIDNPGTLCDIVTLDNGNWVMINNDTESGRHRLTVSFSTDGGVSWPFSRSIADDITARSHYPAIIIDSGGHFHVTYSYFGEDNRKTIKHSVFNLEWLKSR